MPTTSTHPPRHRARQVRSLPFTRPSAAQRTKLQVSLAGDVLNGLDLVPGRSDGDGRLRSQPPPKGLAHGRRSPGVDPGVRAREERPDDGQVGDIDHNVLGGDGVDVDLGRDGGGRERRGRSRQGRRGRGTEEGGAQEGSRDRQRRPRTEARGPRLVDGRGGRGRNRAVPSQGRSLGQGEGRRPPAWGVGGGASRGHADGSDERDGCPHFLQVGVAGSGRRGPESGGRKREGASDVSAPRKGPICCQESRNQAIRNQRAGQSAIRNQQSAISRQQAAAQPAIRAGS